MAESPRRPDQRLIPGVDRLLGGQRLARVQVHRDAEVFYRGPQRLVPLVVQVPGGVGVADVGVAVDQRPGRAQFADRPAQLGRSRRSVLGGQAGEHRQPVRPLVHEAGLDEVVGVPGHRDRQLGVGDRLDPRRGQRHDRPLDAGRVHDLDPLVHVQQMRLDVGHVLPAVPRRLTRVVPQLVVFRRGQMLLQRPLTLHGASPSPMEASVEVIYSDASFCTRRCLQATVEGLRRGSPGRAPCPGALRLPLKRFRGSYWTRLHGT